MQSVDLCRCHVTIFFFKSVKVTAEAHYPLHAFVSGSRSIMLHLIDFGAVVLLSFQDIVGQTRWCAGCVSLDLERAASAFLE